jgi:hypothetical protein
MSFCKSMMAGMALVVTAAYAAEEAEYDNMGPAAFMWPADRVWSADADNTAPCGSTAGPGNRTDFPLRMSSMETDVRY